MLEKLWNVVKALITVVDDLRKYNAEIKDIRQELKELTIIVHSLSHEVRHTKEVVSSERENLRLELENRLLRMSGHPKAQKLLDSQTKLTKPAKTKRGKS